MLSRAWIRHDTRDSRMGVWAEDMGRRVVGCSEVHDLDIPGNERVGNELTVAAPGHGFSAHDGGIASGGPPWRVGSAMPGTPDSPCDRRTRESWRIATRCSASRLRFPATAEFEGVDICYAHAYREDPHAIR
jgi:hypothetical protein